MKMISNFAAASVCAFGSIAFAATNTYDSAAVSSITNTAPAGTIFEKTGAGTVTAERPLNGAVFVREGTLAVHSGCPSYRRYRFMIDAVIGGAALMEIGEFQLLKDGVDVTQGFSSVGSCPDGGGSPSGEGPAKAVDGILANNNKFLDRSINQGFTDKCYLELVYAEPRAIDAYRWATGTQNNASRFPSAYRLLGSNDDGETWDELDRSTIHSSIYLEWQGPLRVSSFAGSLSVSTGATLAVAGQYQTGRVVNMGTVSIAGGSFLEVTNGSDTVAVAGGFSGAGGIVKSGAGTMVMDGSNTYSGTTRVLGGTLRFGRNGTTGAKWFRARFRSGTRIDLSEWSLFDAAGNRVGTGLARVAYGLDPRLMAAGTCTMGGAYNVGTAGETVDKLFDGSTSTKLCLTSLSIDSANESTWVSILLRLPDDAAPVASYNFTVGAQNWNGTSNSPGSWLIEASHDGENWFALDEVSKPVYPSSPAMPYNGGTPMAFTQGVGDSDYKASWLRFTFKKIYRTTGHMALKEIFLLDANGATQSLSIAGAPAGTAARDLNSGECVLFTSDEVTDEKTENTGSLFDGSISTKFQWKGLAMDENEESTWRSVTLRLPVTALPVAGYQFVSGDQAWGNSERCPSRWIVEASYDGETWQTVHEVTANPVMPGASNSPYNGGAPFLFTDGPAWSLPAALPENSALEVAEGASVEICDSSVVKSLVVDMAGAGSISGFTAAPSGTLRLVNAGNIGTTPQTLPISISGTLDQDILKTWSVTVNGVERPDVVLFAEGGALKVYAKGGLMILLR